jgi:hypothetical protein
MFSEKIGFKAKLKNEYFNVLPLGIKNKNKIIKIPDVLKILIDKEYYWNCKKFTA